MSMNDGNIAKRWRELQGIEDNWEALLAAPELDIDLRRSLLVYGNLAAATGDSLSPTEPLDCLFDKNDFMEGVGLAKGNIYQYEVTKYIYYTALGDGTKTSRYGAFVAVATEAGKAALGRRDIVVAWSGTMTQADVAMDNDYKQLVDPGMGKDVVGLVHEGFHTLYTTPSDENSAFGGLPSAKDQVLEEIRRLVDLYGQEPNISITLTGHSLGGALAQLSSIDIVGNKYNRPSNDPEKQIPVTAITFAEPMPGNQIFATCYGDFRNGGNLNLLRVTGTSDIVPGLPPDSHYAHAGKSAGINATNTPYLNPDYLHFDLYSKLHELEVYLHGVAGSQNHGEFSLVVKRQVELVNKHLDIVIDPANVPKFWWGQKPPTMVQLDDGTWVPNPELNA